MAGTSSGGVSPISLALAWTDWALHAAGDRQRSLQLAERAFQLTVEALTTPEPDAGIGPDHAGAAPVGDRRAPDARFSHPAWTLQPWARAVALTHAAETWWAEATDLPGMAPHHRDLVSFYARQWLDMCSPSNLAWFNPAVLERTRDQLGANLVNGAVRAGQAMLGVTPTAGQDGHRLGVDVATTPGRVVFANHLVELIQYEPTTKTVAAEPIFIVPSWIMKYYILDLSPGNSLVGWLVEQGHTVFILSWRNPDRDDRGLLMADYLAQGVYEPLVEIGRITGHEPVQAVGYCLGGTLLAVAAAALERPGGVQLSDRVPPLAGVSLFATETDFTEPGELGIFIDDAQVAALEELMDRQGFLTGPQMGATFTFLHSREQLWSRRVSDFLLDQPTAPTDLMAWNTDVTRMPAAMHAEYLRRCYLHNEIAEGRFPVEGEPVALSDLHVPLFVVATETDHVSPWRSVYKIHRLADTDITFVLTNGGHNAGILSEPGHPRRRYAVRHRPADGTWVAPQRWAAGAEQVAGSWWLGWQRWLDSTDSGRRVPARALDDKLPPAPGSNVFVRYDDPPVFSV